MVLRTRKLVFFLLVMAFLYMLWSFKVVLYEEPTSVQPSNLKRILHTPATADSPDSIAVSEEAYSLTTEASSAVSRHTHDTPHSSSISELPEIFRRGLWQRVQVAAFCQRHGFSGLNHTLPDANYSFRSEVFRHMIYDNKSQSLFCFMPKVGCTNMRSTLLLSHNLIPAFLPRMNRKKYLVEKKLERAMKTIAFTNDRLTDEERLRIIRTYKRFTILRHPLERLLSAYIDKIRDPKTSDGSPLSYFDRLKDAILSATGVHGNANVSFNAFLQWLVSQDYTALNEHFMPQYYNCEPCRMDYHFYGNFENFSEDANSILEEFKPGLRLAISDSYHKQTSTTSLLMSSYYAGVPPWLKKALHENLSLELEFYHCLFPQHEHLTKELLS
ncbi:PREDICTED: carbohydrate sulfotransferase 14-like [Amphimedon queenslandica]|uniref:Carbohydrate sulfotransferase n=2 Tax=Amphimedon queenslandica TaxID=400682 RepID=A0AAN0ICX9_AMPQE|nr:PREDICTED: carbohydrate sulfotransferase 14-like [Amphimedon queenslandica]|eukprot:XP_003385546.1 PREDICTED: carbohydrate sulfotransferase 14-like [Amphimedon queenslandica]